MTLARTINTGKNYSDLISLNLKNWLSHNWKPFTVLTFFVLAAYFNSLNNAFISDDIPGIVENKYMGSFFDINQQPLSFMRPFLYLLIYKLSGLQPIAFHGLNLLFHLGTVYLVYLILRWLSGSSIAFFTASIFSVHPVLTESVAWISGGGYSQYTFFFLLCFLAYIFSCDSRRSPLAKKTAFAVSFLAFFLSLSSSDKAVGLPLILLVFEMCFGNLRKNWKSLLPFFALAGFWTLFILTRVGQRITSLEVFSYQTPGMDNPLLKIPIAIISYLYLIFWPKDLAFYHSELTFTYNQFLIIAIFFLLFLTIITISFKKNRQIFFWMLFFLISLLPTLTPFRVAWVVAERYVYLGTLGIAVIIAMAIQKIGDLLRNQKISYGLLAVLVICLSYRTIIRNKDWKNQDTLWLATAKTSPSSPQNHNNLGDLYGRQGNLEKSVEEFQTAIKLQPNYADAYHNLANTYAQMGKIDLAIENYQNALKFNPNLWQSHLNLSAIYLSQENYEQTIDHLQKAITINPQNSNLHSNLGIVYLKLGEKQKAEQEFRQALNLNPGDQRAKVGLLEVVKMK